MKDIEQIKCKRLLFVEGNDEKWFCIQLLQSIGLNQNSDALDIQVIDIGGNQNFGTSLSLITKSPYFDEVVSIGFIRDAEQNPAESSYTSTCASVKKYISNFPIPEIGKVKSEKGLTCGIFIMPDNTSTGMLENLCLESVKTNPLYDKADGYVKQAESLMTEADARKYNKPKAIVQTYLAGQPVLVNTLANAAKKSLWDYSNPVFADIISFIKNLIN